MYVGILCTYNDNNNILLFTNNFNTYKKISKESKQFWYGETK